MDWRKSSRRSTREISVSTDVARAVSNSLASASRSAVPRMSAAFIGPFPVSSHSPEIPKALHSACRNSTLGAYPAMYRRTVSWLVPVRSPMCRLDRWPTTEARRSWRGVGYTFV